MNFRKLKQFLKVPIVRNLITGNLCLNYNMCYVRCVVGKQEIYHGHVSSDLAFILHGYSHAPYMNDIMLKAPTFFKANRTSRQQ